MTDKTVKVHPRLVAKAGMTYDNAGLPINPPIGTVAQHENNLVAWVEMAGIKLWYPVVKGADTNVYSHTQAVKNIKWTIEHNLGTQDFILSVKEATGDEAFGYQVEYDVEDPLNKLYVYFAEALNGRAVLVAQRGLSTPVLNTSVIKVGTDVEINNAGIEFNGTTINFAELVGINTRFATMDSAIQTADTRSSTALSRANAAIVTADDAAAGLLTLGSEVARVKTNAANAQSTADTAKTSADAAVVTANSALAAARSTPYDIGFGTDDAFTAGLVIGRVNMVRKVNLPANLAGSEFSLVTATTVALVLSLKHNGTVVGTINFAAGTKVPSGITMNALTVNAKDKLELVSVGADATARGFDATIAATTSQ